MTRFTVKATEINGAKLIQAWPIEDERGWFMRSFCARDLAEAGIDAGTLCQENHSRSSHGVLRGLHVRSELREAKLVRVCRGRIFDVAVDLRPWSSTYLRWQSWILDDVAHQQVWIPPGCAHGFQALSELTDVCYRVDAEYVPERDVTIAWDDPDIGVEWPLPSPIMSERDRSAPRLATILDRLSVWFGVSDGR